MDDVYFSIFLRCDIGGIGRLGSVDRKLNELFNKQILWKHIYLSLYNGHNIIGENYYDTCKKYYCVLKLSNVNDLFPKNLGELIATKRYDTDDSQDIVLTIIPTEIALLDDLSLFSCRYNYIQIIPTQIFQAKKLWYLNLCHGNIKRIPTEIGLCINLECLCLSKNEIIIIPTEIGYLTKMEYLHMPFNKIIFIPTEIGLLTNLMNISLYNNNIYFIPTEIGSLINLEILHLHGNHIGIIPSEIKLLESMVAFSISSNVDTDLSDDNSLDSEDEYDINQIIEVLDALENDALENDDDDNNVDNDDDNDNNNCNEDTI